MCVCVCVVPGVVRWLGCDFKYSAATYPLLPGNDPLFSSGGGTNEDDDAILLLPLYYCLSWMLVQCDGRACVEMRVLWVVEAN